MKTSQVTHESVLEFSDQTVEDLCHVFNLLSNESRLRILLYLSCEGELDVTALCNRLHQSQPAVSHHLALMRLAGIVSLRRQGKHNYYSVRADLFRHVMSAMAHEKATDQPCDQFLECVFKKPTDGRRSRKSSRT